MRDFAILLALGALAWVALARAWLGVVALAAVGFLHPQGYASGFLQGFPAYQAMFAATCAGLVRQAWFEKWRPRPLRDWRLAVFGLLWAWFVVTTWQGINPWVGWWKLGQIARMLPPLILVWLLIDSREKLSVLLAAIGLSIALAAVKGGYWALMTGFGDRVYGPPGSQYEGNNEFAVAVVMAIPLLVLWLREARDPALRWVLRAVIVLCYGSVLSSWSRGGLLAAAVVTVLIAWHGRSRLAAALAVATGAAFVLAAFPPDWFARMATLLAPAAEGSAAARLEIWRIGLDFVAAHPVFGGGFEGWIYASLATGGLRDWHSAYIEMAAEHGLVGLVLWLALLLGSIASVARRAGAMDGGEARVDPSVMIGTSLAGYAAGAIFLGIAYWEFAWWLVAAAGLAARLPAAPALSEKLTVAASAGSHGQASH